MVLCRFFQQGYCRYGDGCRFEHSQPNAPVQYNTYRNQYSYNKPAAPQSSQITNNQITELATFMRTIMNDMCGSEQGKQWLLTCYGPTKGKPNFPNFTDTSFEEVRWSIYEAKEDTEKLYKVMAGYAKMQQDATANFKKYQTESVELKDIIKSVYLNLGDFGQRVPTYEATNIFSTANTQSNFGQTSIFPQANQGSIFGGTPAPATGFGNQNSPLAANTEPAHKSILTGNAPNGSSIFGTNVFGNVPTQNSQNIFLQQPATQPSVFGNQPVPSFQSNQNIFAQPPAFGQNPSVFGQTPTTQTSPPPYGSTFATQNQPTFSQTQPIFSQTQPIFSQTEPTFSQTQPAFSQPQPTFGQTSPFGAAPLVNSPPSGFGTLPPYSTQSQAVFNQNNIFTTPASTQANIFSQSTPTQASIFANSTQNSVIPQSGGNIFTDAAKCGNYPAPSLFGTNNMQPSGFGVAKPSVFGGHVQTVAPPCDVYSKLEELSQIELDAFQSNEFEFGKIPTIPPPLSLCH